MTSRHCIVLLVEDNSGDVRLVKEALRNSNNDIYTVYNGEDAISFLRRDENFHDAPRPDYILLDINLPRRNGWEVLQYIKEDDELWLIPVIMWTTSQSEQDVQQSYQLRANCHVVKPTKLHDFFHLVQSLDDFWGQATTTLKYSF